MGLWQSGEKAIRYPSIFWTMQHNFSWFREILVGIDLSPSSSKFQEMVYFYILRITFRNRVTAFHRYTSPLNVSFNSDIQIPRKCFPSPSDPGPSLQKKKKKFRAWAKVHG